eukprot:GEMP01056943.1.p1 GENE.GEMP01056943.1~~GEMP01056943.1.p1  ORF type:complete len:269 (+),score=57.36 GEMP01056943.1:428-1234(+)
MRARSTKGVPSRAAYYHSQPKGQTDHQASALSLEEACYLAKEFGIFTKEERENLLVRSPSFSSSASPSPFIVDNFLRLRKDLPLVKEHEEEKKKDEDDVAKEPEKVETQVPVPREIHHALARLSDSPPGHSFWYNGQEWLSHVEARGTRKRSVAHVVLKRGIGKIKVNGEEDFFVRFHHLYNRFDICNPLLEAGACGIYDVYIGVKGGGISGQSGAAGLAVARALVQANPVTEKLLNARQLLHEDTRQVLSKSPGKVKARKKGHWSKR